MPLFQYKALQADGSVAQGEIEAGGRQDAFRQMEGRGLRPIQLAERNFLINDIIFGQQHSYVPPFWIRLPV